MLYASIFFQCDTELFINNVDRQGGKGGIRQMSTLANEGDQRLVKVDKFLLLSLSKSNTNLKIEPRIRESFVLYLVRE